MACPPSADRLGAGSTAPPRPLSPCTCPACRAGRSSGVPHPAVTGTEPRPTNDATASALAVVFASSTLPATVVRPASSISGDPAANAIASASSMPGSQSRMMVVLMAGSCPSLAGEQIEGIERSRVPPPPLPASRLRRLIALPTTRRSFPMHQPPIPQIDAEDPEIAGLMHEEARRQQKDKFRLIASENYVSTAVLEASGTLLTNKYSEGYPGKRYYEGQQFIDQIESIAVSRAQALFGVEHANVQPYSGSPANLAAYLAFASPGDTIMGLALAMGGHLTHGAAPTIGGKWFHSVQYGVRRDTGRIDFDEVRDLALRERPKVIFCGGTALPRTVDFPAFAEIAAEVDAVLVADIAHIAGLVAGGAHPSPVGFAPVITTTTHKTLRGPRGAMIMTDAAHATAVDKAVFPGLQGGPHNHTTAAIAVALHEAGH